MTLDFGKTEPMNGYETVLRHHFKTVLRHSHGPSNNNLVLGNNDVHISHVTRL